MVNESEHRRSGGSRAPPPHRRRRGGGHRGGGARAEQDERRAKASTTPATSVASTNEQEAEWTCPVCLNPLSMYALGRCGHVVCVECCVRMRVLAKHTDCPICRLQLDTVVFMTANEESGSGIKLDFDKLQRDPHMHAIRRFGLLIENDHVLEAFNSLLEHRCPKCDERVVFRTLEELEQHVRRTHSLFFCDLCIKNLSVFTHERRVYTRPDLALHRRKGDVDDKSHKGHPLCEFCQTRYYDNDALFKHLRREHYFCHFCDADGIQHYYNDYEHLRQHFEQDHYLCTEGDCRNEQFTAVFRTQIDLQAHRSERHSDALSKSAARQMRTIDLDLFFTPRSGVTPASNQGASNNNYSNRRGERGRSRQQQTNHEGNVSTVPQQEQRRPQEENQVIFVAPPDVSAADHFPTLGASASSPALASDFGVGRSDNIAQRLSVASGRSTGGGQSGSGRQWRDGRRAPRDEDFPSLPGANINFKVNNNTLAKKASNITKNGQNRNREEDFPSLGSSSKPATKAKSQSNNNNNVVSVSSNGGTSLHESDNPSSWTKVASHDMTNSTVETSMNNGRNQPKGGNNNSLKQADFPSLPIAPSKKQGKKNKTNNDSKSSDKSDGAFSRIQPMATVPTAEASTLETAANLVADEPTVNPSKKDKANKSKGGKKAEVGSPGSVLTQPTKKLSSNNNSSPEPIARASKASRNIAPKSANGAIDDFPELGPASKKMSAHYGRAISNSSTVTENKPSYRNASNNSSSKEDKIPPPGFENGGKVVQKRPITAPPPGFAPCDEKGFKMSYLQGASSASIYRYCSPSNFSKRNSKLVSDITRAVGGKSVEFGSFKTISADFHRGRLPSEEYYMQCIEHLGIDVFMQFLPELISLLPDIRKQQELLSVHLESGNGNRLGLSQCGLCEQLLASVDVIEHNKGHVMDSDFPAL